MKPGRALISTRRIECVALTCLATMTLVFAAAARASESAATPPAAPPPEASVAPTPEAATPRVSHHRPATRLTVAQSIDESVRRLSRALDLDLAQQVRLRQILVDQHQQIMQLRSRGAGVSGDLTGAMLAIYDQARTRIRSMLNEEQLQKYPAAVPREQTAPAQADLQHWMQLQEARRKQDAEVSQ